MEEEEKEGKDIRRGEKQELNRDKRRRMDEKEEKKNKPYFFSSSCSNRRGRRI
jgi:hypothetical protein